MTNNVNDSKNTKLTKDELYNLIELSQAGSEIAMENLFNAHLNFIAHTVKNIKVNPAGIEWEDLFSEAKLAFLKAILSFKTTRDCMLTTYSKLPIEYAVKSYIATNCRPFGVPEKVNRDITHYYAACNKIYQQTGNKPSDEEILRELKWDSKKLNLTKSIIETKYLFLDETPETDEHSNKEAHSLAETIAYEDDSEESDEITFLREVFVPKAFAILSSKEANVVKLRFGFNTEVHSFSEIAVIERITEDDAKKIFNRAIRRLKNTDPRDLGIVS